MRFIEFTGLGIVVLFTILYVADFYGEDRKVPQLITAGLGFLVPWPITMTIMSLVSARRISKQTKSIQQIGVRTNSPLMKAYIALWFNHAVLNTTIFVLWMLMLADEF